MEVQKVWKDKRLTWFFLAIGSAMILLYYTRKIPELYTVWELADEYGYLANAAYMSGTDWAFLVDLYYGYGYSFWLVPLFWVFDTGIEIIHGAVIVNAVCVVGIFWVQYVLMSKLFPAIDRNVIVLTSGVFCFYPYLVASGLKVIPECLVTLMVWVCGLVFYQALHTGKGRYYVLLALAVCYTFFVHTRTIVFCAALMLVMALMFFWKKIDKKNLLLFLATAIGIFLLGTFLKNHIMDVVYSEMIFSEEASIVRNTLSITDIFSKVIGIVTNFSMLTVDSFSAKVFYIFCASAGMAGVGLVVVLKDCISQLKEKRQVSEESSIKLMYVIGLVLMVAALVVNPMGADEGTGHYFYARYYEYMIVPVAFLGLGEYMEKQQGVWVIVITAVIFLLSAAATLDLSQYLDTQELYYDSNRMPAFTYILMRCSEYSEIIKMLMKFVVVTMAVIFLINRVKFIRWVIPLVLLAVFMRNNQIIVHHTVDLHSRNTSMYEVAHFIYENFPGTEEVYFLDKEVSVITVYTGMQSLLGPVKLNVIKKEDLDMVESGDLIITFCYNPYIDELELSKDKRLVTEMLELHYVN